MNQRELALDIIYKTIRNESYSNLLMRNELNKFEPIQRAFITNLVNNVLRKYEILNYQFADEIDNNTSLRNKIILAMALYERFYLNEKDYVVNNEYAELGKNKFDKAFLNAILHKTSEFKKSDDPSINACLPKWIYSLLKSQYEQDVLDNIIKVYQSVPKVYYRLNKHKCSFKDLKDLDIEIINEDIFSSKNNLLNTSIYKNGYFYVQDCNSASLYKNLDLQVDNTLLDVCCAPGSKLFNCLDVLNPQNCYANDIHSNRVELIKKMAIKLGFDNINYLNFDGRDIVKKIDKKFDRILLDAPCSGLGVISRKPDLKFHITSNSLDELEQLQLELLNTNIELLKTGGILLYSTCTLNKKENSRNVNRFIMNNNNCKLLKEETIINEYGDCFYYAKILKE